MWLRLQFCVWESHKVNVTFTGLATSFAKTCLCSVHSILCSKSLDGIATLTIIFMRYEMFLIKLIFSFPAPKSSLQFQINYKIGFAFGTHCSVLDIYSFQLELFEEKDNHIELLLSRLPIHFVVLQSILYNVQFCMWHNKCSFFSKFQCFHVKMIQFFTGVNYKP